jgi:hypothetical protein
MATRKTLNFLPSIFRTDVNRKFLGSTLDQLISEPSLTSINGFIGRNFSSAYKPDTRFITETTTDRQNYQFEPAVVTKNQGLVEQFCNYQDLLDSIGYYGGNTINHQRLFENEYYSYDPKIDLDKFVNYSQYYWVPNGPDAVTVSSGYDLTPKTFVFTRTANGYVTNQTGNITNPQLTLVRGIEYQFVLNQPGNDFYIQTEPGTTGVKQYATSVTTRDIQGLTGNNGVEQGTLTFVPPEETEQNYYFELPVIDYVDYAAEEIFSSLDGRYWNTGVSPLTEINGSTENPNNKYIVFLSDADNDLYWVDYLGNTVPSNLRTGLWQISLDTNARIKLSHVRDIPVSYRLSIRGGLNNRGYEYFKDSNNNIVRSPSITAPLSTLYYQDGTSSEFYGEIKLVDSLGTIVNVETDILGQEQYTSPRGIEFANGLKITFDETVLPTSYQNKTYIVEGVGTSIKLIEYARLDPVEFNLPKLAVPFDTVNYDMDKFDGTLDDTYVPEYIVMNRATQDLNAWARTNRWVHESVLLKTYEYNNKTIDISRFIRAHRPIIEFKPNIQLYNHGRLLLDIIDRVDDVLVSTAPATSWVKITDAFSQIHNQKINNASIVLMKYVENQKVVFVNDADISVRQKIFSVNYKNQSQSSVFDGTGAGTISVNNNSTIITGFNTNFTTQLFVGSYVYNNSGTFVGIVKTIFNDIRAELTTNSAINISNATFKFNTPTIELIEYKTATEYDYVVVRSGVNAKKNFWFNGQIWNEGQQKNRTNQYILFDVIDSADNSFSSSLYDQSTFVGNKIFSYKTGNSSVDPILNFSISYNGLAGSIADINFDNSFEVDDFSYVENNSTVTEKVSAGFLRINSGRYNYDLANVWDTVAENSKQFQHFVATFGGITNYFEIDILPDTVSKEKNIKVFVNNSMIADYDVVQVGVVTAVKINQTLTNNDKIDILVFNSSVASVTAYYQIPLNLEFNALNSQFSTITLGQVRIHWNKILENILTTSGQNFDYSGVGGTILQHSAGLVNSAIFLAKNQINFVNSIDYARKEYTRFKNKFLELASKLESVDINNIAASVDTVLTEIVRPKNSSAPWFYSDMVPLGVEYVVDTYKVTNINTRSYNLPNIIQSFNGELYDFGQPTEKAILVYLNNQQLTYGVDYNFAANSTALNLSSSLVLTVGDILTVRGYASTDGCYVPETPTKLGLHPKFLPVKYLDNTYRTPVYVIQGHDGSITPAFNDFRDDMLLELEKRIYNNIKVPYAVSLFNKDNVIPGKFRNNDYSVNEFNQIITSDFMRWIGSNQIDYTTNESFQPNDSFTWNYNQTTDSINGEQLLGYWRGIYRYFYDTDRPHTHPWEMLGISEKPTWWDSEYGAAPYTSNNTKLWQDLEAGYNRHTNSYDATYTRTGLSNVLPVDTLGNLVSPQVRIARNYNGTKLSQSFAIGDVAPVESAWRRSSEYPYALQKALALTKPAKYFGLLTNTTDIVRNSDLGQFVTTSDNMRPRLTDVKVQGQVKNQVTTRVASYVNWIRDYVASLGFDIDSVFASTLEQVEVNLSYKLAGFSDKKYLTALMDQYSTTSTSDTVVIPDENYQLYLNKSVPRQRAVYSAVIVEKTTTGYSISGYDLANPFFTVIPSELRGKFYSIDVLGARALIFQEFINQLVTVPYGYELSTPQEVVDFLISYQRYLSFRGFIFEDYQSDLAQVKDWVLSAKEFLTWTLQGWTPGNVIILSPVQDKLLILNDSTVVDEITNRFNETQVLNPAFKTIPLNELTLVRDDQVTTIKTTSGQTITFADLNLVQYEHVLVFDNKTVFNDTIYTSELGNRQYRIKLVGSKTNNWNGSLHAPGFIYNSGLVDHWRAGKDYQKGDLVNFKKQNYVALQDIVAADTFNVNNWALSNITTTSGLIPNFSNNSKLSEDFYNIDSIVINENHDLFSNSLIGYRSRSYLENLGMDQTTQSKFYQGFIKTKGTVDAINTLFSGRFDNTENKLNLYEEWAVRVGEYGAINSKQTIEISIASDLFKTNPAAFELVNIKTNNNNLIQLNSGDLHGYSTEFKTDIFLNNDVNYQSENNILTAGYVNIKDVDAQVFDLANFSLLNQQILPNLTHGYKIWVAKDLGDQWQVYKAINNNELISIEYSLDNKLKLTTLYEHGLQVGDVFAVKNFDNNFDGFYQVLNVEDHDSVIVTFDINLLDLITDPILSTGQIFLLDSLRYSSTNDRNTRFAKAAKTLNDLSWVDNATNNSWQVFQLTSDYSNVFTGDTCSWDFVPGQIKFRSSGLPAHSFGSNTSPVALAQNYNRIWPLWAGTNDNNTNTDRGTGVVGFWLNGVAIQSPNLGDFIPEGKESLLDFNYNLGYQNYANLVVDSAGGIINDSLVYTYIDNPLAAWVSGVGNVSGIAGTSELSSIPYYSTGLTHPDGHSKIVGFSLDGYPIYGPFAYTTPLDTTSGIKRIFSSYRLKDSSYRNNTSASNLTTYPMGIFVEDYEYTAQGDLDQFNGRYCVTPDYPQGTYAYFMTTDLNNQLTYPYVIGDQFYGQPAQVVNTTAVGSGIPATTFVPTVDINTCWTSIAQQSSKVNIESIDSLYLYNNKTKEFLTYLDYIDPIKGKILGVAQDDIDFVSSYDPAKYNMGSTTNLYVDEDFHWGSMQLGTVWWDTNTVRYIDYEQYDLDYRLTNWSQMFPGSSIDVYEWVRSNVLPSEYVAAGNDGEPKYADDSAYVSVQILDTITGQLKIQYFYWVKNKSSISSRNKKYSVTNLAQLISNPRMQNIPYAAILKSNSIAVYNIGEYIKNDELIFFVGYKTSIDENQIFNEYEFLQEGNPASVINSRIENKIIDSLVGFDTTNNMVPDLTLPVGSKYGVSSKPNQTLVSNRLAALKDILTYVNKELLAYPFASRIVNKNIIYSDNLYAKDPEPALFEYDLVVENQNEFGYVSTLQSANVELGKQYVISSVGTTDFTAMGADANTVGVVFTASTAASGTGTVYPRRILIKNNNQYNGFWSLVEKNYDGTIGNLIKLQRFDTEKFWYTVDWYVDGITAKTKINYRVEKYADVYKIDLVPGDVVKIKNTGDNFELYRYSNESELELVGLGNGTIQLRETLWQQLGYDINPYDTDLFDFDNAIELRYIFKAIKEDLFIDDLNLKYNEFIFYIVKYILNEQRYVDWIFKTSFISVLQSVNQLTQDKKYIKDRQLYYQQYINEVKPYRTKLREYVLNYQGRETTNTLAVTDFDLPAYYDSELDMFRSPNGQLPAKDTQLLSTDPRYQDWKNHHKYSVEQVVINNPGIGYLTPPDVVVESTDTTGNGTVVATSIDIFGAVTSATVVKTGDNYINTPIIAAVGTGTIKNTGTAKTSLSVRLSNGKIRKIKTTIKFDRITYTSNVVDWQPNTIYSANSQVSYNGRGYTSNTEVPASNYFDLTKFDLVSAGSYNNANDRIIAYYSPTANMVPKDLDRLMTGLSNPVVDGNSAAILDTLISSGAFTGQSISVTQIVAGTSYIITSTDATDFTQLGAIDNRVGIIFTATGPGTGDGTVVQAISTGAFGNVSGLSPADIVLSGGAFIDRLFSHAPEELLPGITYDTISIKMTDNTVSGNIGYRRFIDLEGQVTNSEINESSITSLAQNFNIGDSTITVTNASGLPTPGVLALQPGVLHINGERIEYYTKVGNVLGQLRRGVGGTAIATLHPMGSTVESVTDLLIMPYQ